MPKRRRKQIATRTTPEIPFPKVRVEWIDILSDSGWASDKEFDKAIKAITKKKKKKKKKNIESEIVEERPNKTVHFRQDRVHDFAWFADPNWIVQKGVLEFEKSNKKITLWSMYLPKNAKIWRLIFSQINCCLGITIARN